MSISRRNFVRVLGWRFRRSDDAGTAGRPCVGRERKNTQGRAADVRFDKDGGWNQGAYEDLCG